MVYQEQLIQAVQVLAGFTLAQADVLRKISGFSLKLDFAGVIDLSEDRFEKRGFSNAVSAD